MCGSRSGIIFFCSFSSLFLLCLAPDAFAITQNGFSSNGRTFTAQPSSDGSWRVRDAQIPEGRYYPSEMPKPVGTPSGITDLWQTPNLPVPYSSDAIPGIVESDLVKFAPLASVAAPFIVRLVGLSPEGRAAVLAGSAVMSVYADLYPSEPVSSPSLPSGSPSAGCGSSSYFVFGLQTCSGSDVNLYPTSSDSAPGYPDTCSSSDPSYASDYLSGPFNDGSGPFASECPVSGVYTPSSSSSPSTLPAPTVASLTKELEANPALATKLLQALPQSLSNTIPMQQTASGPKSVTGQSTKVSSAYNALPSNLTQPSSASGTVPVTKTVTSTPTYTPTYNASNGSVTVSKTVTNVTKVCTAAGSCTTTDSTSTPASIKSPFVPPSVLYPNPSTAVPTTSTPFTAFSFGSPWLPKVCPSAPTYQVCVVGGSYCKTEKLPTNIICKLASGIEPVVTAGGGLLGILILAW